MGREKTIASICIVNCVVMYIKGEGGKGGEKININRMEVKFRMREKLRFVAWNANDLEDNASI